LLTKGIKFENSASIFRWIIFTLQRRSLEWAKVWSA